MTDITFIERTLYAQFNEISTPEVEFVSSYLTICDWIPLPILVSKSFDRSSSPVVVNERGDEIAELIFVKDDYIEIAGLPLKKFICLIKEYPFETIADSHYTFTWDYELVMKTHLQEYISNFKKNSAVWGSYLHQDDLPNNVFVRTKGVLKLNAIKGISIDRPIYLDTLELAIRESNPFNRFLKLYHLLELNFDIHTAEKLSRYLSLGNKEKEISSTLKDYNREDLDRLRSLLAEHLDCNKIIPLLNEIRNYVLIAEQMFYVFGKDSNPLKQKKQFDQILSRGGFAESHVNAVLGNNRFADFIPKITSYWIYRIRSSIAHNKLGEYLITSADESFMLEFAEPLLKEVVIDCFKS